ncbi:helix-turn-helix domain-containing protein [Bacteroidota bacterium]
MTAHKRLNKSFTRQINEILDSNINNERFGVSELAYEMNMSRSNLHRRIKSATGDSVSQYLRKVRLNKAMELLKEQSFTISEVAFAVGFGSVSYFSKCFKDQFGYPPGEVESYPENIEEVRDKVDKEVVMKNFPVQTTSFIGRENEITTILELVRQHRFVSLIGTGGCGKTRLACEAISKLGEEYKDGIWFVSLAPVESEELVLKELMNTLEIAEAPGKDLMEVLVERISGKKLLILLDNCEHLLSACARLSAELIHSVPGLSIVATSREALNIKGEKVWYISPLSLVDPASMIDVVYVKKSEAVRLFADRALLNNPEFKLAGENIKEVATICQKVDGIPLAVELVASRTKYMDVKTMIGRFGGKLAEIPAMDPGTIERHKTLQSTIEWSYNLLKEDEKTLFRSLSIFAGGFDLDAVEEVCAGEYLPKERILDIFPRLIDTCLVQTVYTENREMRYTLLETLRQFGMKILSEKNENVELSKLHLEYFTGIAEQAYDERMSKQAYWMGKIHLEHNNTLAALRWAELHVTEKFQRLAANLSYFWGRSNNYSMAIEILERAIAINFEDKETRARMDYGYGSLLVTAGEFQKSQSLMEHGLSIWQELKNKKEVALMLAALSDLVYSMGDNEAGMKYAEEGYKLVKEQDDPGVELNCMMMVIFGLVVSKKTKEARPVIKKALKMAEELENLYIVFGSHHMLGDCALMDGLYHESEQEYSKGIETALKSGDTTYACTDMLGVAMSVAGQGRYAKALRLNAAASSISKSFGGWIPEEIPLVFWQECIKKLIVGTREKLGEELTNQYEEEGRAMSFDEAVKYALNFEID